MQTQDSIGTPLDGAFFTLIQNGMFAYYQNGTFAGASQPVPNEDGLLTFKRGIANLPVAVAQIYCDLVSYELRISRSMRKSNFETRQPTNTYGDDTYPFTLGVNGGDEDHFSLCQSSASDEVLVVYNVSGADSQVFDTTSCTSVFVNIIPESG